MSTPSAKLRLISKFPANNAILVAYLIDAFYPCRNLAKNEIKFIADDAFAPFEMVKIDRKSVV